MYPFDWGRIAMFGAFFDESSDGAGAAVCLVAGWHGDNNQFEGLNDDWSQVLADFGIADFHAYYCENFWKYPEQYPDFNQYKADALRDSLCEVVKRSGVSGYVSVINLLEAPESVRYPHTHAAYLHCMEDCLIDAYSSTPDGDKLFFIFDKHTKANGRVPLLVTLLKRHAQPEIADKISDNPPKPGNRQDHPGLQAADFLAYEVKKDAECRMKQANTVERRWFTQLQPLIVKQHDFNEGDIQMLVDELKLFKDVWK
jgi:hypothetical protein